MSSKVEFVPTSETIDEIIKHNAKLNELSEAQVESVREAVKQGFIMAAGHGYMFGSEDAIKIRTKGLNGAIKLLSISFTSIVMTGVMAQFVGTESATILIALACSGNYLLHTAADFIISKLSNLLPFKKAQ